MSRRHGRNAAIYFALASGAQASPLTFQNEWSINFGVPKIDVTAFGDGNKVTVAGLPEASGSFAGFYDDATAQTYTAAVDGVARPMYIYPDKTTATRYFFGTVNADINFGGSISGAITVSSSWEAASQVQFVG